MSWRVVVTLLLIAWGALAFGAVYAWASLPLFVGCAAAGLAGTVQRAGAGKPESVLVFALAGVVLAIGTQLVPLPIQTIRVVSPATDTLLERYTLGYPAIQHHALSIEPRATIHGLAAMSALALFLLGLARVLRRHEASQIARGVIVLGVVLAVIGVTQKAMWNGKIYGLWAPTVAGDSFGPFINRNHFAGWMLMALPLALGYFCGRAARGMGQANLGLRERIVWLSSADASETVLVGFSVIVMALALTLTMSRSGMIGLLVALVISCLVVIRHQASLSRRAIGGYLIFVTVAVVAWTGFDTIAARFADTETSISSRLGIWTDTWRLAGKVPLAGTGLNTYSVAMLFYQKAEPGLHFAQAHNDYLQLVAEGGVLVCGPATLAILAVAWTVRRRFRELSPESTDYWIRFGAVTGIVAVGVQ